MKKIFEYYKKLNGKNVVQLAVYEKTPEQFNFVSGFSSSESNYAIDSMEKINEEEYRNLINILNIGHRPENAEPVQR